MPDLTVKNEVEHAQIDFINSNRLNSIITMAIGALFLYFFLGSQVDSHAALYWICIILIYFEETLLYSKEVPSKEAAIPAISVSIMDQGTGVPEDELETVFEKFVQSSKTETGAGGTGLGLSISKEIIEGHGGYISAKNSSKGCGAIFTFSLPRKRQQTVDEN